MRRALLAAVFLATQAPIVAAQEPHCPTPIPATARDLDVIAHTPHTLAPLHAVATGAGVRVAVIDTGVAAHPRLKPLIDGGDTITDGTGIGDCDGHGTIVAGIIAAQPGPDGLIGIAPDADIITIRQSSTPHEAGSMLTLLEAIRAARRADAHIITMSIASCVDEDTATMLNTSELAEEIAAAHHDGILLVAAAGNQGSNCPTGSHVYPAAFPHVLAVSARENSLDMATYSMPTHSEILSAPGTIAVGLSPTGQGLSTGLNTTNGPAAWTGTSFAAPFVAGVAALIRQHHPHLSADELTGILHQAATGTTGALDPTRALSLAATTPTTTTPTPITLTAPTPHTDTITPRASWILIALGVAAAWAPRRARSGQPTPPDAQAEDPAEATQSPH